MSDALFPLDPAQARMDTAAEHLSADRKRTLRQIEALKAGSHPLSIPAGRHIPLHAEAAPAMTRLADGRRCGNCVFRAPNHRGFFKCWADDGKRATRGPATDVRAWWPGCRDHQYAEEVAADG